MKNIEIWSRETDRKILASFGVALALAAAALMGWFLPEPVHARNIRFLGAFVAVILLVFVWAGFRLLRPIWYRQTWLIAEAVTVPLLWVLLITALGAWFARLNSAWDVKMDLLMDLIQPHPVV